MPDKAVDSAISQWDRYWSFGSLHSFSQVTGGNYTGAIAAFWQQHFSGLRPGAHVVDIATGNGAVPLFALEAADRVGIDVRIDGTDLASIDPVAQVNDPALRDALARIHFHPRTPAESLPFEDASVTHVCSQYGLEYSDLQLAVAEIGRITSSGAIVALVLHNRDSVLLQATELELEQLSFVLDEARLWMHARNLLRAMTESGGRNRSKVERKRAALDRALQRINEAANRAHNSRMLLGPTNYIHEIMALAGHESWQRLFELLEESRQRLLANRQRLIDMQSAACNEADIERLVGLLREQEVSLVQQEPLHEDGGSLLGWKIVGMRE